MVIQYPHLLQPDSHPSKSIHPSGFVPPPAAVQTLVGRVQGRVEGEPLLFEETLEVRKRSRLWLLPAACLS